MAGHRHEVGPSSPRWSKTFPTEDRDPHQHDACSVACWMQQSDAAGSLAVHFQTQLRPAERTLAQLEGWIPGLA